MQRRRMRCYNGSCVDMMLDDTTVYLNVVDNIYNHGDC